MNFNCMSAGLRSGKGPLDQTPAGTNTQGLLINEEKFCLCNDICKRSDGTF